MTRKLSDSLGASEELLLENEANQIDDALRYTMILSTDDYKKSYQSVLNHLANKGFDVHNIWNAWTMEGKPEDTGYRGINVTIISSKNQRFELQFHTADSFRVKTETHGLYEERRNPITSQTKINELLKIGKESASKVKRPKGI